MDDDGLTVPARLDHRRLAGLPARGRAGSRTTTPAKRAPLMADHFSDPRALADPASDITDV
ncbi:MAG TPA: hypothetical protein VF365_11390, partial [Candidatus Limnocylindria bacterium]